MVVAVSLASSTPLIPLPAHYLGRVVFNGYARFPFQPRLVSELPNKVRSTMMIR